MGPEAYYAAGILTWYNAKEGARFYARSLRGWSEADVPFRMFLADDVLFRAAIELLEAQEILTYVGDPYGPHMIEFRMDFPLSHMAESYPNSVFAKAERFGQSWIEDALLALNDTVSQTPATDQSSSEETWEPLPIDNSQAAISDAIEGAEAALAGIKADNGFSTEFPHERDNLVGHASATLASAKDGVATKSQIRENLVQAGRWLLDKFGGTAIGSLGGELMKWGLRLLGLL